MNIYNEDYYKSHCGNPYEKEYKQWLIFFNAIADWIVNNIKPKRVLDIGCAKGFLVEALRDRGVECYGIDISKYAISQVRDDIKSYCSIGSILEPFPHSHYDLITCIEVLEHLPEKDAEKAIETLCRHTDNIIFSSTPNDFNEPTHLNVQPMDYWVKLFSRFGFYRDILSDVSFISPQCMRFKKRLNGKNIKVSCFSTAKGSCSIIRLFSPIQQCLKQYNISVKPCLVATDKIRKDLFLYAEAVEKSNIIILQRGDIIILRQMKELWNKILYSSDKKVIYDIDDLLLDLPPHNPDYEFFNKIKPYIIEIINQADLITVSTCELKRAIDERIPGVRNKIVVLPNFIDLSIWKKKDISARKEKPKFLFAGTPTHSKDLEMIEDAIEYILRKYKGKVEFEIWGEEGISKNLAQYFKKKPTNYTEYANNLLKSDFDFALVPLVNDQFNRCKSNIKWLEYGVCGIPTIFSNLPPYSSIRNGLTGVLVNNNVESWINAIEMFLKNPDYINFMAKKVQKKVLENHTIQKNAFRWFDMFCCLLDKKEKERHFTSEPRKEINPMVPTSIRETRKLIEHIISDSKEKEATHFQQNKTNKTSHRNVSIVMPVFNKLEYTTQCIDALYKVTPNNSFELIVVNNASTDGTKEYLNKLCDQTNDVKVIHNDTNLGFAKACNQGAGIAKRKYLVFLNNDTVPLKSWLESMLEVVENEDNVGVVGSKLLFPDNTIQHAGIEVTDWPLPVFPFHIYYRWPSNSIEANKKMDYPAVTGACLLTPKRLFNELEGFDEGFLNSCEDVDYCFRVREKGLRVVYTPKSVLYHYESVTDGKFKAVKENKKRLLTKWKGRITVKHNPKVGIVVLSYSGAKNTIECLESIDKNTNYKIFQVILVDNVSRADDIKLIESWKKETGSEFIFIRNYKNLGFADGSNVGIKKALKEDADFVWLLNNDTVVEKGTLENLLAFGKSHNIGMVSSKIYSYFDRSKVQYNGKKICYLGMPDIKNDKLSLVDFAPACSVLIPKEVFKKIGFLDEDYFFYCEDNDFCKRLKTAGFQILYNPLSKVYHKCNASSIGSWLKNPSPISAYYATRNLLYFAGDKYEEILSECFFHLEKFYWKNLEKGSSYIKGFVEGIKDHILRKKGKVNSEQLDTDFWIDWPDKELEKIAKKLVFSIDKTKFFEFLSLSQEILLKNIKQKSKDKAYHLCEKGEEKYKNGDIEKAIILFEEAIKLDNTCHTAYNNLAAIYWQMQDIEMSHCFINKAIELAPKDPNVFWNYKQIKSKAHAAV